MKGLEALKNINSLLAIHFHEPIEEFSIIEKELKALEIIKNKNVNTKEINNSLKKYNDYVCKYRKLTREEFDLLKEVLENE